MNERGKGLGWKSGFFPKHLSKLSDGSSKSSPSPPFYFEKWSLTDFAKNNILATNEGTNFDIYDLYKKNWRWNEVQDS